MTNLGKMKESAPGPGEFSRTCSDMVGKSRRKEVVETAQSMWNADPSDLKEIFHLADVIPLLKKGSRQDLDNCRHTCLLQIISRLIARIGGRWLTKHSEEKAILATEQWGFRRNRYSTDAVFVMARLKADAEGGGAQIRWYWT